MFIPQRPSTITVLGEVMQPGSYSYRPGMTVGDYIKKAGGYAQYSDEDLTFIVQPDGEARRLETSWLSFDATALPPGSTIVIPRDLAPLTARQIVLMSPNHEFAGGDHRLPGHIGETVGAGSVSSPGARRRA